MPSTEHFGWPYPKLSDEADPPAHFQAALDAVEDTVHGLDVTELGDAGETERKPGDLLIVGTGGVNAWKAMQGDATFSSAGFLTIGDGKVTSRKFKPTAGFKQATGAILPNNTYQMIPGCELLITPEVKSLLLVNYCASFEINAGTIAGVYMALGNVGSQVGVMADAQPASYQSLNNVAANAVIELPAEKESKVMMCGIISGVGTGPGSSSGPNTTRSGFSYLMVAA